MRSLRAEGATIQNNPRFRLQPRGKTVCSFIPRSADPEQARLFPDLGRNPHHAAGRSSNADDTGKAHPPAQVCIDGAASTTLAAGASYKTPRLEISAGFGVILEGTRTDSRTCNPDLTSMGCAGNGVDQPTNQRQGPDPIVPILDSSLQSENPVNEGTYKSHYLMFMLGASTWF